MSDMKVGLSVRAQGKQAQRELKHTADATDHLGQAAKDVGTAATGAGAKVKKAAREQAQAVRQSAKRTTEALGEIKRSGSEAGEGIRRGMREGVRAERDATRATDRLGSTFSRMIRRVGGVQGAFRSMGRAVRAEVKGIKRALDTTQGKLASLGVGFAASREVIASAKRDRTYIQMQQTAEMSPKQRESVRGNAWRLARKYGVSESSLEEAQGTLLAKGFKQSTVHSVMEAVARTSAVTGSLPSTLANVAATAGFNFKVDLNDPKAVQLMMDQMTVATRAGGMEMEDLANAVPVVGPQASMMGLDLPRTLALMEVLSKSQPNAERNADATMAGLRLFTRKAYRDQLVKATGDKYLFFDKQGNRQTTEHVLAELRGKYAGADNAAARASVLARLTKHMESRTVHWLANMLKADNQVDNKSILAAQLHAGGAVQKSLPENLDTATAAAGRMKATFGQAMDEMSRPINKAFADVGSYLVENYSGKEMLAAGATAAIAAPMLGRLGKGVLGKMLGGADGAVSTMRGIAVGHALNEATGTMPVFVTNWSGAKAGMIGGALGALPSGKMGKLGKLVGAVTIIATGVMAIKGINAALKPVADKEHAWEQRMWRDDAKKRLGMNDTQLDTYRAVKAKHPYGAWLDKRQGQYSWWERLKGNALDDYHVWLKSQAAKLGDAGSDSQTALATRDAAKALEVASDALKRAATHPVRIEVTSDNPALHAQIVDHAEREARRG